MIRKILAVDLDGTAVDDRGKLGGLTKHALFQVRRQGHIVCFVTGRRDIDMLPLGKDFLCADYLLLNNGGKIVFTADGRILKNDMVEEDDARRLITFCLKKDYLLHIISGMYWAINKMTPGTSRYIEKLGTAPVFYRTLDEARCEQVEGFMATTDGGNVGSFIDEAGLGLTYVPSEPNCIDIMKKGISKWGGIQFLADYLNIPAAHTITAGNYTNDIDMLVHAGVGVAVQNALPDVKDVADYVTRRDNNHDAVAEIVEKYILTL